MKRFSVGIKLCIVIVVFLVVGFVCLNFVSVRLMKNEVMSQIKKGGVMLAKAYSREVSAYLKMEDSETLLQNLMDELHSTEDLNYVLFISENEEGKVMSIAHSNHERIGIELTDAGSVAAAKDGTSYCDFYDDPTTGLKTLDVVSPIYSDDGKLLGAFDIGVPVDSKTINAIVGKAVTELTIISLVIAVLLIVLIIIVVGNIIGLPLQELGREINSLRDGNLDVHCKVGRFNGRDELEELSDDVNNLIEKLKEVVMLTQNHSTSLKEHAKQFVQVVNETNEASENVGMAMNDVAEGATNQAENTSIAMNKIQDLSDTLEMITKQINELNHATGDMKELSHTTKNVLEELVQANDETKSSVNDIVEQSNETLRAVEEIDSIIRTIDEISSQTNLLSLNASIEAARAGEAGRGFAVVATEIGALAQNSADSAKQIGVIIERVKDMIKKSADFSNLLDKSSEKQIEKLGTTEKSIETVIESVSQIAQNTNQIHAEVENLDRIKLDIRDTIESLSAISEENAASAQQTAASMNIMQSNVEQIEKSGAEIGDIAEELNETINYFH